MRVLPSVKHVRVWAGRRLEELAQDGRFALRTLRTNPGFAATAILTLALATGATTAIFSIASGVLLRPLPFADPDRLVQVYGTHALTTSIAPADLEEFRKRSTTFESFAGYDLSTRHLQGPAGPERLAAVSTDAGFFSVLGARAPVGRVYTEGDPLDVVVISAGLWRRRFDADPSVPGRTITLDGRPMTVLGVVPDRFQFPYSAASMMPGALPENRTDLWLPRGPVVRGRVSHVIGRLKPRVPVDTAAAELRAIAAGLAAESPEASRGVGPYDAAPLADIVVGSVRRSLWILLAAVGLVLAAACANVANLLLARTTVRTREVVTRAALGAGRLRLVRQFLAESLVLSLAGAVLGVGVAQWSLRALVAMAALKIPRAHEIALDWRAFLFLLAACVATALLFGIAPAIAAARMDLRTATNASGGAAGAGRAYGRLRDGLVVIEVALAFVLVLGAALVVREAGRLRHVDTGMTTGNVLVLHLTPRAEARDYYAIEARVAGLPGVQAAGFIQLVPLQNWGWETGFAIRGRPGEREPIAGLRYVTPGYFRTLGIPVLRGRPLSDTDRPGTPRVILINHALAQRYFPGEDPVGRETNRGTIVGVVGDVRNVNLDRPAAPEIYYPAAQNVTMAPDIGMSLLVRTSGRPDRLAASVRAAVRQVNPNLAVFNVKTMDQVLADSLWDVNLYRRVIGLFAVMALAIAAIGLYGVIVYTVSSRRREFAVRLALGSDPRRLARLVLARAAAMAGAGLAVGLLIALAVTPALRTVSAGLRNDPATYAGVATFILAVAIAACAVPAIRAAATDPASALRHE